MKRVESVCNEIWGIIQTRLDVHNLNKSERLAVLEDISASCDEAIGDMDEEEIPSWEDNPEDYMGDDEDDDFDTGYDDIDELEDDDD